MKLLGERILVKELPNEGLIITDSMPKDDILKGEVIAIGNKFPEGSGCEDIKLGDVVQWNVHAGHWTKMDGFNHDVCILRMNDIVCILDNSIIQKVKLV